MTDQAATSLTSLLGEARAAVLDHLGSVTSATCAALAEVLGVSTEGTRKHLALLLEDGLVTAESVPSGRGRPAHHYALTDKARRLFPTRAAAVADELFDFISSSQDREALRDYLAWRSDRQTASLAQTVDADDVAGRVHQLAAALDQAGYGAKVTAAGDGFELTQHHCVIREVASSHPELCATEAQAFARVLGDEVNVSRHLTIAGGAPACVCRVDVRATSTRASASTTSNPPVKAPTRSAM